MKSIDVRKKHEVTLTFLLDEEVTPHLFAVKIARACSGGTLRPGEAVMIPGTDVACFVTNETLSLPSFGQEWWKTRKTTAKRAKPARKATAKRAKPAWNGGQ